MRKKDCNNMRGIHWVCLFYDINCSYMRKLSEWVSNNEFINFPADLEIVPGIRIWHVHSHQPKLPLSWQLVFPTFHWIPLPSISFSETSQLGLCTFSDWLNTCSHVSYHHSQSTQYKHMLVSSHVLGSLSLHSFRSSLLHTFVHWA